MPDGNGANVTWRELNLSLAPIHEDLSELKKDVKLLLISQTASAAAALAAAELMSQSKTSHNMWTTIIASTVTSIVVAVLGLVLYIH